MSEKDKHQRFIKVAEKRTNDILDKIRLLGNCSNKRTYYYEDPEVNKIFSEIDKQLKATKAKFTEGKKKYFRLYKDDK